MWKRNGLYNVSSPFAMLKINNLEIIKKLMSSRFIYYFSKFNRCLIFNYVGNHKIFKIKIQMDV